MTVFSKAFLLDAAERVVWTFIQTFVGIVTADGFTDKLNLDAKGALIGAAIAAGLSAAKCLLASRIGDSNTAQALPGSSQTYTTEV